MRCNPTVQPRALYDSHPLRVIFLATPSVRTTREDSTSQNRPSGRGWRCKERVVPRTSDNSLYSQTPRTLQVHRCKSLSENCEDIFRLRNCPTFSPRSRHAFQSTTRYPSARGKYTPDLGQRCVDRAPVSVCQPAAEFCEASTVYLSKTWTNRLFFVRRMRIFC